MRAFPGVPTLAAQLLHNRGIETQAQLEAYLSPGRHQLLEPLLLPDMDKAVARLRRALSNKEAIGIFGDFDADGVTATALLVLALQALGATVLPYIPHRLEEGHGLNAGALRKLKEQGASVVITADCGISNVQEVAEAHSWGLDVIITDHHSPPATLPAGYALISPRLTHSVYPFLHLTGVGMAFKLIQGLYDSLGKSWDERLLALAAIGTVADVAPLVGENRAIIKEGLKALNGNPGVGLAALIGVAGLRAGQVDAEAIGFALAPRINAAGRLDDAMASYRLLVTQSSQEATELAETLNLWNRERQELTRQMLGQARADVLARGSDRPLLWVMDRSYHPGVIGLVAGRLVEEFYRPAIVVQAGEVYSRGSCRSIPEFDVIDALSVCSSLFERFGGHRQAAGFTIRSERLPLLARQLQEIAAERLAGVDLTPTLDIDAEISLAHLGGKAIDWISRMAPFGYGNPSPAFLSRGVQILERHSWGADAEIWRMKLKQGNAVWQAVAYNLDQGVASLTGEVDVVYRLAVDRWTGQELLRLEILDMRSGQ